MNMNRTQNQFKRTRETKRNSNPNLHVRMWVTPLPLCKSPSPTPVESIWISGLNGEAATHSQKLVIGYWYLIQLLKIAVLLPRDSFKSEKCFIKTMLNAKSCAWNERQKKNRCDEPFSLQSCVYNPSTNLAWCKTNISKMDRWIRVRVPLDLFV